MPEGHTPTSSTFSNIDCGGVTPIGVVNRRLFLSSLAWKRNIIDALEKKGH